MLTQKRARVERALEQQAKEGRALTLAAQRLQVCFVCEPRAGVLLC